MIRIYRHERNSRWYFERLGRYFRIQRKADRSLDAVGRVSLVNVRALSLLHYLL